MKDRAVQKSITSDEDLPHIKRIPIDAAIQHLLNAPSNFFFETPFEVMGYFAENDTFVKRFNQTLNSSYITKSKFESEIKQIIKLINQIHQNAQILLSSSKIDPTIKQHLNKWMTVQFIQAREAPSIPSSDDELDSDSETSSYNKGIQLHIPTKATQGHISLISRSNELVKLSDDSDDDFYSIASDDDDFDITDEQQNSVLDSIGCWLFCPLFWPLLIIFGFAKLFGCL